MDPISFFGRNIFHVLNEVRDQEKVVEYSQIEGDEFLKFSESGFYLHSKNGSGEIFDCRIYFVSRDGYFPANIPNRGLFGELENLGDFEKKFGRAVKEIRAVKIPGAEPTLPGKIFENDGKKITAYSSDGNLVDYVHVKLANQK
jgi:hypothetical protein